MCFDSARSTEKEARGPPTATGRWFGGLDAPPPKSLREMLARPAPLFDAHATMAALENLVDVAREKASTQASRYAIILRQTRSL